MVIRPQPIHPSSPIHIHLTRKSRVIFFAFSVSIDYNIAMIKQVLETIKKYGLISSNERVLTAISGGADSVALLHVLKGLGYNVCAAHINHMIRGEEALRDECFVVDLCRELDIPLLVYKKNCPEYAADHKLSLEEAARILRYEALESARLAFDCQKIATAHTQSDNIETMLMRLIRGSSSYGLRGIDIKRGHIIRPLLHLSREDIESYVQKHNLSYVTDGTNKDMAYLRNRVRHMLLPELAASYNPNIRASLARLSKSLKTDADYFAAEVRKHYTEFVTAFNDGDGAIISADAAKRLHPAILERLIRYCVEVVADSDKDFDHVHTMMVKELFDKTSGKKVHLTKGLTAANSFGDIAIYKEKPPISAEIPLGPGDFIQAGETDDFISLSSEPLTKPPNLKENFIKACAGVFICDKMYDGAIIRGRKDGDLINKPCGRTVKLKDFLIERRVPVYMRDNIYVVACGSTVFMVLSPIDYAAPPSKSAGGAKIYVTLWRKI